MKYFGEFLVSKGIVKEEALVEALVAQISSLPSVAEIIFNRKLVPAGTFLRALTLQSEKRIDFKQACIELGAWKAEFDLEIQKDIESHRIPLGHLLVRKKVVDLQTVTKALDEFLSKVTVDQVKVKGPPAAVVAASGSTAPAVLKKVDEVLLEEFLSYLTQSRICSIQELLLELNTGNHPPDTLFTFLNKFLVELHTIRGLMRCIRIEGSESIVAIMESYTVYLIGEVNKAKLDGLPKFTEIGTRLAKLLTPLLTFLKKDQSEDLFLANSECAAEIEWIRKSIQSVPGFGGK